MPGTFGSAVGLLWVAALLCTGNLFLYVAGSVALIPVSVWLCGEGEKILRRKDPGSVVMDEIVAMPWCFLGWVAHQSSTAGWPGPRFFLSEHHWMIGAGIFILFRIFDVTKPWPVRGSQSLPGGWGVTVDDLLAAGYVNLVVVLCLRFWPA